jgi:hypothetical protein
MFKAVASFALLSAVAGCSPSGQLANDAAKEKAEATQHYQERQAAFAAKHEVIWPELLMHEGGETLLTVDVQRQLAGKRVALDVFFPNVREENGTLILSGLVLSAVLFQIELEIDAQQLEVVRSNRHGLWVAANIVSVTPKHEAHSNADAVTMETVCYASGKVLGLASSVQTRTKE